MVKNGKLNNAKVPFKDLSKKDKTKRVMGIIGSVGQIILVVFALILSVIVIVYSYDREDGALPSMFGVSFLTVESQSMDYDTDQAKITYELYDELGISYENKFKNKDLIIVKEYDGESELKVGDVVTFWDGDIPYVDTSGKKGWFNTHRIIEIRGDYIVTRGDNNPTADTSLRIKKDVKAIWNGAKITGWGKVIDWIKDSTHFLLVIVLPLAILFFVNVFMFIREIVRHKVDKSSQKLAADKEALVEEAKKAAIAEFLARQQAEQAAGEAAQTEDNVVIDEESSPSDSQE